MTKTATIYWVTQTLADLPESDDWLTHNEITCMNKLRFPKRRVEWRLGRWTAKRALLNVVPAPCGRLSEFIGSILNNAPQGGGTTNDYFSQIEIRAAADGAPEAFVQNQPMPITLSISHRDEIGFCVINSRNLAIGCDIEKVESRSDNFVNDYFTAEEKELIAHAPEKDQHWLVTLIWSAKESAMKTLRQGLRLDTRSVSVVAQASSLQHITPYLECHSGRIFFESEIIAGNEQDSFGMTKSFTEQLRPREWNHLTVRYTETARTFRGWWRQKNEYIQTIVTDLRGENVQNPTQHASAGFCFE